MSVRGTGRSRHKIVSAVKDGATYGAIVLILFIFLFPLIWMYISSVKPEMLQISSRPVVLFRPTLAAYRDLFRETGFAVGYKNSLVVAAFSVPLTLLIGCLAGYSLSRFEYRGREDIGMWILSFRMLPPIVSVVPLFVLFRGLGLLDTWVALVVLNIFANLPVCIWLMRSFYDDLPLEIEEAALVDGCSRWGVFTRITLPLSRSGLFATGILVFVMVWNEFLFAFVMTRSARAITAPVIVAGMLAKQGLFFGRMCAACSLLATPILFLALFFGRYLLRGLTFGALKG